VIFLRMPRICLFCAIFSWALHKNHLTTVCSPTGAHYTVPAADPER
jgi:hypothetical protein